MLLGASIAGVRDLIEVSVERRPTPPPPEAVLKDDKGGKNRVRVWVKSKTHVERGQQRARKHRSQMRRPWHSDSAQMCGRGLAVRWWLLVRGNLELLSGAVGEGLMLLTRRKWNGQGSCKSDCLFNLLPLRTAIINCTHMIIIGLNRREQTHSKDASALKYKLRHSIH